MTRFNLLVVFVLCAGALGCNSAPGPAEDVAKHTTERAGDDDSAVAPPQQDEPVIDDEKEGAVASRPGDATGEPAEAGGSQVLELKESGIGFVVPAGWKRVKPQNNIIEAEFELPRAEGDEYDGRLTLMSSGGDPQEVIATRTAEFKIDQGEEVGHEKIRIGGFEATLVDLRGEWKGSSFQPMPPRPDYRMLLFVIPFSERSGFYAKLTGPRTTIAAHEEAFREFLRSAKITREAAK
ncbi:MAG: hypothetical protein ACM3U2_20925 [Deltaproteobacteria bacterium]